MKRWKVGIATLALAGVLAGATPQSPGYTAYEKANTLFVEKKFPESLAAIEEALRLDPMLVPALTLKAKLAMAANRYDVARQSLERALAIDPKAGYAQFLYGLEAFLTNDMKEALPRFEKARELRPKDSRAALYLGLTTESVGSPEQALALYEEAVKLETAEGEVHADTLLPGARLLMLLGRLEESERWLRRAGCAGAG
jgi:tetratricopeptide (TPR) repeat protein